MSIQPETAAVPSGYIVPAGDYTPPSPGYRRPGSDHTHIPHSLEAQVTQPFEDLTPDLRREMVLRALRTGPRTVSYLLQATGAKRKTLDNTLNTLRSHGMVSNRRIMGHNAGFEWMLAEKPEPAAEPIPDREPVEAPEPERSMEASPLSEVTRLPDSERPTTPEGIDRIAIAHDGSLLLWVDGELIEIDRDTTKGIFTMLHMTADLRKG